MKSTTTAVIDGAIEPRENGTPPPEVALRDVDLGTLAFWALDDDYRCLLYTSPSPRDRS